ncbi:ABC transporter ATP-binding protein [Paenibacillus beijingensis]|uniref:ABC transporter n=1 Tax=Paenibacillus beijingensis TaxID=1126833 RepID=A0A0D5NH45_9BACL|nr:ABC transporter ATP-binding protein [Paenibacillus beijingensis]AJY74694.1 ABC transporter [Paenibacillus beijingensis]
MSQQQIGPQSAQGSGGQRPGAPGSGGPTPASFGFGPGRGGPAGMGMPVEKAKNFKDTFRRLVGYLQPHRFALIVVFLTAVLSTVFSIIGPKILGNATTAIFEGTFVPGAKIDFAYIADILLVLAGLYIISSLFGFVQQYVMASVAQKTVRDLRRDVNEKLARLPLKYFDSRTHGEIMSRAVNDVDNISGTLQQSLTQFITSIVTLLGVVVMMLSISWVMTLITIVTLPLSFLSIRMIAKRSQLYFKGQQKSLGELNGHIEEMYTGHSIVKAFGHEEKSIRRFDEVNGRLYESGWRAQFVSGMIMPLMGFIGNIGYVLVSVAGGLFVLGRSITIGDVQAFISYSRQFTMPITQTAQIANIIQSTIASAERIFELLDETEEVPEAAGAREIARGGQTAAAFKAGHTEETASKAISGPLAPPKGNVRFEHVKFGYKEDVTLIEDMNIDVKSGQTVAIVGPTGAGKTTLINLLMRFYELSGGRITIDGADITRLKRGSLRSIFGMVLQDTWLFNGTIRDNIAYGRAGATEEEVVRAARAANADHFIRTLPGGYDTVLNEEASNISQGQKQLLTIARAILADPAILILDEATSSVDTRTEIHIQRAMSELMQGRTSFVIAHRLSTIRDADLILVMNHGSIIEQGTHEELLTKGGFYADLYQSQFSGRKTQKAI